MFQLRSPDRETIVTHTTNTIEVANLVKDYIESKYNCTINISKFPGLVYYDVPGPRTIYEELFKVEIGHVETRVDDVDMLVCYFKKEPDFSKGFMRIPSFWRNICLSEKEFQETKDFINNNPETIQGYFDKTKEIYAARLSRK